MAQWSFTTPAGQAFGNIPELSRTRPTPALGAGLPTPPNYRPKVSSTHSLRRNVPRRISARTLFWSAVASDTALDSRVDRIRDRRTIPEKDKFHRFFTEPGCPIYDFLPGSGVISFSFRE